MRKLSWLLPKAENRRLIATGKLQPGRCPAFHHNVVTHTECEDTLSTLFSNSVITSMFSWKSYNSRHSIMAVDLFPVIIIIDRPTFVLVVTLLLILCILFHKCSILQPLKSPDTIRSAPPEANVYVIFHNYWIILGPLTYYYT